MKTQTGFLLSYLKYGDYDAILHAFTKEKGYQSFFLRGVYSSKNKKKAYLLPLNELHFSINTRRKGNISSISQLELVKTIDIAQEMRANSIVFFVADFLNQILRNEENAEEIYEEIKVFLHQLEQRNYQSHLIFLFRMLIVQGFLPLWSDHKFLDPESGKFSNAQVHPLLNEEISSIWKSLIASENSYEIQIKTSQRKDFLDTLLVYYHLHFADFRTPHSLEIVQQLFE